MTGGTYWSLNRDLRKKTPVLGRILSSAVAETIVGSVLFQSFVKCNLVITPVRLKHQLRQHPIFSRFSLILFDVVTSLNYPFHSKTQPKLKFNKILKFHFIKCWKTKSVTWKRFQLKGPQTQTLESLYKKTYTHGRFIETCQLHKCPF